MVCLLLSLYGFHVFNHGAVDQGNFFFIFILVLFFTDFHVIFSSFEDYVLISF